MNCPWVAIFTLWVAGDSLTPKQMSCSRMCIFPRLLLKSILKYLFYTLMVVALLSGPSSF